MQSRVTSPIHTWGHLAQARLARHRCQLLRGLRAVHGLRLLRVRGAVRVCGGGSGAVPGIWSAAGAEGPHQRRTWQLVTACRPGEPPYLLCSETYVSSTPQ